MNNFTQLDAWKEGHKLVLMVYKQTKDFPQQEHYGLTSQMRRSAVSVTSNIAEGFGRYPVRQKANFYSIANGSLIELTNQIQIAHDVRFLDLSAFNSLLTQITTVHKLLYGLICSTKKRIT